MDLYIKSQRVLELPAVLQMLAGEAVSEPAKEKCAALAPTDDFSEALRRMEETTAAARLIANKGSPTFSGVRDVRGTLRRADMGGALNPRELLDVAGILRAARITQDYSSGQAEITGSLDHMFRSLTQNKFLEKKITDSIISEEEISDNASAELANIRRLMRAAGTRVRESLQKIISSPSYAKALQDPIITMRSDRYVVPVKAEHKSAVPGLVHDISASGATLFIEPMQAVKANNEIRELLAKEKKEIERILAELTADVAAYKDSIELDFEILVALDVIFAKGKLSYKMHGICPSLSEKGELNLRRARHPLLPKNTAVPIDISLGVEFDTLVITGPNTGGKTVSLKTLGLLSLMAACGLHIPAGDGSNIPVFKQVLADIGDEQSIEQSLSTFSSHMTNIVAILERCEPGTLLLFDELGAGTDPVEGAALAVAIIERSRAAGALTAATTHYAELKTYASVTKGVQNASCEFDVETLRPTYRLLTGIPGKSNAFAISRRLGLSEEIIAEARGRIGRQSADFEEAVSRVEEQRRLMEKERLEAAKLLLEAKERDKRSEEFRKALELEREKASAGAKKEARSIIEQARRTVDELFEELSELRKSAERELSVREMNEARTEARRKLNETEDRLDIKEEKTVPPPSPRPVRAGDTVRLLETGTLAEVISVNDKMLTLQAGILKIQIGEDEVRLAEKADKPELFAGGFARAMRLDTAPPDIDIRGMTADEGIHAVGQYLDNAVMAKLKTVSIIHGKGTGALRKAVQTSLRNNGLVKSFRAGTFGEGEMGVTVVELK